VHFLCVFYFHTLFFYAYILTYIHTYMHTHTPGRISDRWPHKFIICKCCTQRSSYIHTHTYIHTYVHTYIHACTHIHQVVSLIVGPINSSFVLLVRRGAAYKTLTLTRRVHTQNQNINNRAQIPQSNNTVPLVPENDVPSGNFPAGVSAQGQTGAKKPAAAGDNILNMLEAVSKVLGGSGRKQVCMHVRLHMYAYVYVYVCMYVCLRLCLKYWDAREETRHACAYACICVYACLLDAVTNHKTRTSTTFLSMHICTHTYFQYTHINSRKQEQSRKNNGNQNDLQKWHPK
jgi:hypothetical protein